jgi:hypothetical protein
MLFLFEGISQLGPLVVVHILKNLDIFQEFLIFLSLFGGSFLHNMIEGLSVKTPELSLCFCCDCSCTRRIIKE